MALGKRKPVQQPLFVSTAELNVRTHPFYDAVNKVLDAHHFDTFVEDRCAKFYDDGTRGGRPGLAPGIYFRCLLVGYFEGIDSERGIDWRCNDSISLKTFLGLAIGYQEFLGKLAKESGIETPTREDLAKLDKKRKNKASNDDWQSPDDPDARITKMKDGTTHLAHKAEHAVDMGEGGHGAIVAVNVCDAAAGDTATLNDTLTQAAQNLRAVADDDRVADKISEDFVSEAVLDKGYHGKQTLQDLGESQTRSYVSEPDRGRQDWDGQADARDAVYANRRRIKGERGKRLLRSRGEKLERTFAHCYETGGMRRLYLRGRENVAKRTIIHAAGFNIGLLMRVSYGLRKPRSGSGVVRAMILAAMSGLQRLGAAIGIIPALCRELVSIFEQSSVALAA